MFGFLKSRQVSVGSRVTLSGGYDIAPRWLGDSSELRGTVLRFIPSQNAQPAAVVQLDKAIAVDDVHGDIAVLELRYEGQAWGREGTVHVELCDVPPDARPWKDRKPGLWVESHATYRLI